MKPILFNTEMVRAILDGRKTVTRRVVKVSNPDDWEAVNDCRKSEFGSDVDCYLIRKKTTEEKGIHYPQFSTGDILYVRETWQKLDSSIACCLDVNEYAYVYKASKNGQLWEANYEDWKWKPSIHMPKEAARVFLKVTAVRIERLQDINNAEAKKEGVRVETDNSGKMHRAKFSLLWNSVSMEQYGWDANPLVWVIEFERCEKEVTK